MFLAALLYLPSILYYNEASDSNKLGPLLGGSLICTEHVWVPCPECRQEQWASSPDRLGRTVVDSSSLIFALKNNGQALEWWPSGINHLVVMLFLAAAIMALGQHQLRKQLEYDESMLTASDYSIQVDNPPMDAVDPEEWKDFFQQFGEVAFVTVALNNSDLLKALTRRRVLLRKAQFKMAETTSKENIASSSMPLQSIPTNLQVYQKLVQNEQKCQSLLQRSYPTSAVFIIFQTEQAQRHALQSLRVGQINVRQNNVRVLKPQYRFRGNLVLDVLEAPEPTAIRWQDLDETCGRKVCERIVTILLTIAIIGVGFVLVRSAYQHSVEIAAIIIALLNMLVPHVFKAVNSLESHQREASYQASLYWKITIFRWVNTVVVTILIQPFAKTLSADEGLVTSVQAVLRAEIIIPNLLNLCDIVGHVKRQILAPRAINQAARMSHFRGSRQNLGEKYTNLTKTIFLVVFYSSIFPAGLFYGATALALNYVTDKFGLLRSWAPLPELGNDVATLSRKIFFPLTIVALAISSIVFYSEYPCDNLCDTDLMVSPMNQWGSYEGTHLVLPLGNNKNSSSIGHTVSVAQGDKVYRFCQQDIFEQFAGLKNLLFAEKNDWMTGDQEYIVYAFSLFAVLVSVVMVLVNVQEEMKVARIEALGGFVSMGVGGNLVR